MVVSQLQKSSLEHEYSACDEYRATPTTNLFKDGARMERHSVRN